MKIHVEKRILLLFIVTSIVLATLGIFSYLSFKRIIETARLLTQASRTVNSAEQIIRAMVDIETGQRGYVITGDEAYLSPYYESSKIIAARLVTLDSLTSTHEQQHQRVTKLTTLIKERIAWSAEIIQARTSNFEEARDLILQGKGKTLMDSIRSVVHQIQEHERNEFRTRNTITTEILRDLQIYILALAFCVGAVIVYLFYSINKSLKVRTRIEEKLIQAAEEVKDLYNNAPCGYHSINAEGIIINMNDTELSWLGYNREEVIGKLKMTDLLSSPTKDTFSSDFEEYKRKGYLNNLETEYIRKDGTSLPVIINSKAFYDAQGRFIKSRASVFDNTAKKKAEQTLREREERFRSIVSSVHDALIILDENGFVQNWNTGAEKIFGWKDHEMIGQSLGRIIPIPLRKMHEGGLKRYQETGQSKIIGKTIELQGVNKEGQTIPVELSISTWQSGKRLFYCGILRDISARKQTDSLLNERAAIVESSDDAIISLTTEGIIESWNKGATSLYGYTYPEVKEKHISIVIPDQAKADDEFIMNSVKEGNSIKNYETVRLRKDGTLVEVSLTASPIRDTKGNVVGISKIGHDITERKKKEKHIKQLNKELDAFTYSVSHDLRAPLRSITGYSQILLEDYNDKIDEEGKRITNIIVKSANRMGQLINDLLDFSKLNRKELTMHTVDMSAIVSEVLSEFNIDHKRVSIKINQLTSVQADGSMIYQVWHNLIANALKYSSKNEKAEIEIGSYHDEQQHCYYVRDNGVGFDMQYVDKLFTVFQRLHKPDDFEGTGVGLALAKRIIQRHQGKIWAEAEINKGATFYFSLPERIYEVQKHSKISTYD